MLDKPRDVCVSVVFTIRK